MFKIKNHIPLKNKNYTLFLADDDADDRQIFEEVLDEISPKINFKSFDNGVDLMTNLKNRSNKRPDYIFLDLKMPMMDGEECLQEIRKLTRLDKIPVIIYSTSIDIYKAERLRDMGATMYLKKPNSFKDLKNAILNCLADIQAGFDDKQGNTFIVQM